MSQSLCSSGTVTTLKYAVNAPAAELRLVLKSYTTTQCQARGQFPDNKFDEFVGSSKFQHDHDRDVARSAGFVLVKIRLCAQSENT